jgi:ferredoxin
VAYKITADCMMCGVCAEQCPNRAISEGDDRYVIDPAKCTECVGFFDRSRCGVSCPQGACVPDPEHVESAEELNRKYALIQG